MSRSSDLAVGARADHSSLAPMAWPPVPGATLTVIALLSLLGNR